MKAPEPGLHKEVPNEEYHAWDAVNASKLKKLLQTPAHALHEMLYPSEPTDAMAIGTAAHCAVLEPDLFKAQYIPAPHQDRWTKKAWAELEEANKGKTPLRAKDYERIVAMSEAVWKHPLAREILSGPGINEGSIVWVDPETKLTCKARPDRITKLGQWPYVVDYKTTKSAAKWAFARDFAKLHYDLGGAAYLEGLNQVAAVERRFCWVAQEKDPPYLVQCFELDYDDMGWAKERFHRALRQWKECQETNIWPGYPLDMQIINLPEWEKKEEI